MKELAVALLKAASALQIITGGVAAVALVLAGLTAIKDGADGRMKFKESIVWILIGAFTAFFAVTIAKQIVKWGGGSTSIFDTSCVMILSALYL